MNIKFKIKTKIKMSFLVEYRYTFNGHRIVEVSSSISSMRMSKDGPNESGAVKKITYSEWMRRKQEMARRRKEEEDLAERQREMEEERLAREKQERECRERENFLKWSERKKKEEEKKKAAMEKELKLQKQLKEVEDKTAVVKTLYLRQWARKKKEEEKGKRKHRFSFVSYFSKDDLPYHTVSIC